MRLALDPAMNSSASEPQVSTLLLHTFLVTTPADSIAQKFDYRLARGIASSKLGKGALGSRPPIANPASHAYRHVMAARDAGTTVRRT